VKDKDLAIIINCDSTPSHGWMSFASFYSIYKKMSDAQVFIKLDSMNIFFSWAPTLGVKLYRKQFKIDRPNIKIIRPSVMAVREISDNLDIVSSKTNLPGCFVDYRYGCGNFNLEKWSNSTKAPFENPFKNFSTIDITVNEYAILDLWQQSFSLYRQLGGAT
jgi:hypothetical protein